jgi:hypothetical protein
MRVITPEEIRRCSVAWNYTRLCEDAGLSSYLNNYYIWFTRPPKVLPDGTDRLAWLKWLYRDACYRHTPAFVVLPGLQAYRRRGTVEATAQAADISLSTVMGWLRKPALKKLLREAVLAARKRKTPQSKEFNQLDPRMRECMLKYAEASTKAAQCRDVGIKTQWLDEQLQEAAGRSVKEELLQYLNFKGPYKAINLRKQYGLINGKLFIIPPAMCCFHDAAVREWSRQNLSELEDIPGFESWFVTWTTPALREKHHATRTNSPLGTQPRKAADTSNQLERDPNAEQAAPAQQEAGKLKEPPKHFLPQWDEEERELRYGDKLCKRYDANPAKNQIDVIEAFQAANWSRTLPDPFRNSRKLNTTIASLNRSMATGTIKFRGDGTGEGINWEPQQLFSTSAVSL